MVYIVHTHNIISFVVLGRSFISLVIIVHGIIMIREKLTSRSCNMQLKKVWMKHQGIKYWYVYM